METNGKNTDQRDRDVYRTVVLLGSSFAAGPGIDPIANKAAGRSHENAAQIISRALGARLIDASVSGATTATILSQQQRVGLRRFAPQMQSVPDDADLILITAGGNDLEYIGSLMKRARSNVRGNRPIFRLLGSWWPPPPPLTPPSRAELLGAANGLAQIVSECRRRAPRARIVLVDYLPIFDALSVPGPALPLSKTEIAHFRDVSRGLSEVFASAAGQTGAELVSAEVYGYGHAAGSPTAYTLGLERRPGTVRSSIPPEPGCERPRARYFP